MRSTPAHGTSIFTRSINTNTPAARQSRHVLCGAPHELAILDFIPNGSKWFYHVLSHQRSCGPAPFELAFSLCNVANLGGPSRLFSPTRLV